MTAAKVLFISAVILTASGNLHRACAGEKAATGLLCSGKGLETVHQGERFCRMVSRFESQFVIVEPGIFKMGSPDGSEDELPLHDVTITRRFFIGKYEITQKLWQELMGDNPSRFKGEELPVDSVSWEDCQEFIAQLNRYTSYTYRLPTEAEWEYAAKGGCKGSQSGGEPLEKFCWYGKNSGGKTHKVGSLKPNKLGIHDMSGNVWEWCEDWYDPLFYESSPKNDPCNNSAQLECRVIRGGAWDIGDEHGYGCHPGHRDSARPDSRMSSFGFRLVREEQPERNE